MRASCWKPASARRPQLELEQARAIGVKLARGAAALHRAGIIHRDIKPDNVILESGGGLKLIDLGTARVAALEDLPCPRIFPARAPTWRRKWVQGEAGNAATDIYALGVTLFRALSGRISLRQSRCGQPAQTGPAAGALRPAPGSCRPGWMRRWPAPLRAIPQDRFADMDAFAVELEAGPPRHGPITRRQRTFYERSPVLFWQIVAALLAFGLVLSFLRH